MEEGTTKAMAQIGEKAKGKEKYFPPEIFFEIVSRLPSKSVGRFTTVSKSWYAFIKSYAFIAAHLRQSIANNSGDDSSHYLLYVSPNAEYYAFSCAYHDNTGSFDEVFHRKFPMDFKSRHCRLIGSCNGLVCLTDGDEESHGRVIYVGNPLIRKYKCITGTSYCRTMFYNKDMHVSVGFWYEDGKHDYKLIRIMHNARDNSSEFVNQSQVELYSLNIGSWRKIDAKLPWRILYFYNQAFLNGTFNWIAYSPSGSELIILSFDTSTEQFRKVVFPYYEEYHHYPDGPYLAIYKGCLAFFIGPDSRVHGSDIWSVWVMNEFGVVESWVQKSTLVTKEGTGDLIGITQNDGIIFLYEEIVMTYNLIRYLRNDGLIHSLWLNYTESLVFLDEENGLFESPSSSRATSRKQKKPKEDLSASIEEKIKQLVSSFQNFC